MKKHVFLVAGILMLLLSISGGMLLAQNGISVSWWTADGGGGTSAGADYAVSGAIGQPDAGSMSGGQYELNGGFWNGSEAPSPPEKLTYLPIVLR